MAGRAPGRTCMKSIQILNEDGVNWNKIPYNTRSVGCGGSMRSACIGLVYSKPDQIYDLIKVSIEAGRITHHNPIGYLGSMVSSFFTALSIQGVHPRFWIRELFVEALPLCEKYIKEADR
jgi:ADP-ribosylarginine hydrolase